MTTHPFTQKAKVGVSGSFINQMMSNNATLPEVGKGATQMRYTDRVCYEVIEVSQDMKTVKLEVLEAVADLSQKCDIGHQNWILKPTGRYFTVLWRHKAWRILGKEIVFTDEIYQKVEYYGFNSVAIWLRKTKPELVDKIYSGDVRPMNVVEGFTVEKKRYTKINLLFGVKDYYYDWSF